MTITTHRQKGSALTWNELDNNFEELAAGQAQIGGSLAEIDAAVAATEANATAAGEARDQAVAAAAIYDDMNAAFVAQAIAVDALAAEVIELGTLLDGKVDDDALAAPGGSALVGFEQVGAGAVPREAEAKLREQIAVQDDLTEAQIADTQLATPVLDLAAPLQAAIDDFKTQKFKTVGATSIRYGTNLLEGAPGQYLSGSTLTIAGDLNFRARGGHSSVILQYTGAGTAIVVNSTNGAIGAPQNTRVFAMEGVAVYAPTAAKGIYFGGATQRHIELLHGQVIGVPGRAIDMGEGTYFLRLGNFEIRNSGEGIYVGHYCDLFTADDRCFFTGNSGPDLILACPTFRIDNCDFEGSNGAVAHIRIPQTTAVPAAVRGGLIMGNRFGPEGANPVDYDIEFVDDGVVTSAEVSTDTRIWANIHFSNAGGTAKIAPINIASKTKRLDLRGYRWSSNYSSGYYVTSTDVAKAFATGTVCDSQIDDVMDAHPSIRGLFATGGNGRYERAWSASTTIVNLSVLRRVGVYSGADKGRYDTFTVTPLVASSTGSLHEDAVGIAIYDQAVASRPLWYAINGTIIPSTLDTTGSAVGAPVYLQASGALGLVATSSPLVVARVNTVGANAKLLVSIENKTASVVMVNADLTARGFDEQSIIYNSAITADRTVTLNTTTPSLGDVVRVTRTELATGAFNVIVSSKTLVPGSFAEFTYSLSGWICTDSGAVAPASVPTLTTTGTLTAASSPTQLADATAGAFTVNLPTAVSAKGLIFTIKKIDPSANAVTVDGNGAETIDGASTLALNTQWQSVQIQSNGTAWYIL